MNRFADVALPVAVEKEFTYLIPPELRDFAVPGVRAIVQFGTRHATGLIVGVRPDSPIASPKLLKEILDPAPVISDELLRLCRWIAEYYFAPLGEVLKAALPHGFATTTRRVVRLLPQTSDAAVLDLQNPTAKLARILALLRERGPLSSTELQKRLGLKTITAALNALARSGAIEIDESVRGPGARPKLRHFVHLRNLDKRRLSEALASVPEKRRRARDLLKYVQSLIDRGDEEIDVADLLKRSGATSGILKGFVISGVIPVIHREATRQPDYGTDDQTMGIVLDMYQQKALETITEALGSGSARTLLIHGVTASGKTQVYIEAIRRCLGLGKTAIVLVPEISLTPQIVRRFKTHFGEQVTTVHSRMSPAERHDVWRLALRGSCKIVIGPRSAVFAPLSNLGLIVVDEEHEASYKQFDAIPRYHARDVAIVRGSFSGAVVVLGSATPSAESYFNASTGKYTLIEMPARIDAVPLPGIEIVDMAADRRRAYAALKESLPGADRQVLKEFRQPAISELLRDKIERRLARGEGTILLQNRRGFAPFVECLECGYSEMCERCNVSLTYHLAKKHLRCHYCGLIRKPRAQCPSCGGAHLELHGIGTQRVEQELGQLFPSARVLRMDLDTTSRRGAHGRLLQKFADRQADILLGTQMVAKGLDFPHVTLVGVISADTQMLLPDFRASERTFQLLTQVAGRAGRSTLLGEVVIQTHQPAHPTLKHVIDHDFASFYQEELAARQELAYPPFSRIVLVETRGKDEGKVRKAAERFADLIQGPDGAFMRLGPAPAVIGRINNYYRWHIIIKDLKARDPGGAILRQSLQSARARTEGSIARDVRITIDVDPVGMM